MFLGWIYEYVFAVILSSLALIYNMYCFVGLIMCKKNPDAVTGKLNFYVWVSKKLAGKHSNNKKKLKRFNKLLRKINVAISVLMTGILITNIVLLSIIYTLNIQATNISNILTTLFGDSDCSCYAKCTGNEEDDAKTAYELLFGPTEYDKFTAAVMKDMLPSDAQPFVDMIANEANGKEQGEWLISHLNDDAVQCYKEIVGDNNKFRAGDHQDRSKMTNGELKDDLVALLKDYKVGGRNPNCERCFDTEDRKLATRCIGEAHWVPGWTWEAIWDSDNPGDGSEEEPGDSSGGGSGGNIEAQNSKYGIQLNDGWYFWYHQSIHECDNNVTHGTYGRYGSFLLGDSYIHGNANTANYRACSTYATAMALSNVLRKEITPWDVVLDVLRMTPQQGASGWYGIHDGSRGIKFTTDQVSMNKTVLAQSCNEVYGSQGLVAKRVGASQAEVDEALSKGGMVVYSWGGGPPPYYDGNGHFMTIRYKDSNGLYYLLNSSAYHDIAQMNTGITWQTLSATIKWGEGVSFINTNPPSTNPGDGNGDGGGKPTKPGDGSYAGQIIDRMANAGYGKYSIAGALGSFAAESGLDPKKTQGDACNGADNTTVRNWQGGRSGRAIGFAQWDGSRAINLLNAADAAGVNWYDFDFQLNFYMAELSAQGYGVTDANANCTDVEHAAWYFTKKFERCGTCKYAPCSGSSYGKISNGAHGVGGNAADVSFENRNHINGWNTRNGAAQNFYNSHLK